MFQVQNNKITITRGDTGSLVIRATEHTFGSSDRALFTIANNRNRVVMQRIYTLTDNAFTVLFAPGDTKDWTPGNYKWEVRYFMNATVENDHITAGDEVNTPADKPFPMEVLDVIGEFGPVESAASSEPSGT